MATVEEFCASPSEDLLATMNKAQLCEVADYYKLTLTSKEKSLKESLIFAITGKLQAKGILKEPEPSTDIQSEDSKPEGKDSVAPSKHTLE